MQELQVTEEQVERARAFASQVPADAEERPDDGPLLAWLAAFTLGTALRELAPDLPTDLETLPGSWWPLVRLGGSDGPGCVAVPLETSMEPRDVWPVLVPARVADHPDVSCVAASAVPKASLLREGRGGTARAIGFLPASDVQRAPRIDVQPHIGHPFGTRYVQAKVAWLTPLEQLVATVRS